MRRPDDLPVHLALPAERSATVWQARHTAGEVPSRWPYGLDQLEGYGVRAVELPRASRADWWRLRVGLGRRPERALGLTWNEHAALRMAAARPHARWASGVIWLTDAVARGEDGSRTLATLRRAESLWVLSAAQVQPLTALVGADVRVAFVPFGIDAEPGGGGFYTARPMPSRPRVVSVGGDRDRDTETLYRALARVHAVRPDVELVVQTSSTLPPPDGVRSLRHLPHTELRGLYASASVVVIATRDNLHVSGMTVSLEAMATGRPVVITDTPGMTDYVRPGETGVLTPVGDAELLAEETLALLGDPGRAADLGRAGRAAVEARHTTAHLAAGIAAAVGLD